MNEIRKGFCKGCPYDYGQPETEMAYNLGCLPTTGEIIKHVGDGAWPCHEDPDKVCCGFASQHKDKIHGPLCLMDDVH